MSITDAKNGPKYPHFLRKTHPVDDAVAWWWYWSMFWTWSQPLYYTYLRTIEGYWYLNPVARSISLETTTEALDIHVFLVLFACASVSLKYWTVWSEWLDASYPKNHPITYYLGNLFPYIGIILVASGVFETRKRAGISNIAYWNAILSNAFSCMKIWHYQQKRTYDLYNQIQWLVCLTSIYLGSAMTRWNVWFAQLVYGNSHGCVAQNGSFACFSKTMCTLPFLYLCYKQMGAFHANYRRATIVRIFMVNFSVVGAIITMSIRGWCGPCRHNVLDQDVLIGQDPTQVVF